MTSLNPESGSRLLLATVLGTTLCAACGEDPVLTRFTGSFSIQIEPHATRMVFFGQTTRFRTAVRDPFGTRIDSPVSWSSSDSSVFTVDSAGVVTAVGDGVATVSASAEGVTATASVTVEQEPAIVEILSGGGQDAVRGRALPARIVVRVTDEGGTGMDGIAVSFNPEGGDGSASPASVRTDADGEASTLWTLGDSLGAQALVISAGPDLVNRVKAFAFPETPIPDLVIAGGLVPPPADPTSLETFHITLRVANEGNAPTPPAIPLAITVDSATSTALEIGGLAAGESVEVRYALGPLAPGDHEILAALDADGNIEEWFEDNNDASATLTVRQQTVLAVGDSVTLSPATAGEVMLFRVDVAESAQEALTARLFRGEGDGDLFVHFGERPGHFHDYKCVSGNPGTSELCHMVPTRQGSYHVAVHAFSAFGPSTLKITAGEPVEPFDIGLVFAGNTTDSQENILREAAARWESVIARGAENVNFADNAVPRGFCFDGSPPIGTEVDDLVILVGIRNIDGEGGTIAQSGPCVARTTRFAGSGPDYREVAVGSIVLDREDARILEFAGMFGAAMEHHIAHVLGFGLERDWRRRGLLRSVATGDSAADVQFTGPLAIAAFDAAGGSGYTGGGKVPVENLGPSAGEHWRGSVFGNELMTHLLADSSPPLSLITIESLADMGYGVDLTRADEYTLPEAGASRMVVPAAAGPVIRLGDDILRNPVMVVDRDGRVVRIHDPR